MAHNQVIEYYIYYKLYVIHKKGRTEIPLPFSPIFFEPSLDNFLNLGNINIILNFVNFQRKEDSHTI